MKTCKKCSTAKPEADFTKDKKRPDGLNLWCRECTRASVKRTAGKYPDKAKARSAKWYAENKAHRRAKAIEWLKANPGKAAQYSAKWSAANPGKVLAAGRAWYWANRERALAADKAQREARLSEYLERERASYARRKERRAIEGKRWRERNKDRIAHHASQRRSALAKRTPPWIGEREIAAMLTMFTRAAELKRSTGVVHHVDHIVPLRGKNVCGLNVPWNLQVIPAIENLKKNNRHEP